MRLLTILALVIVGVLLLDKFGVTKRQRVPSEDTSAIFALKRELRQAARRQIAIKNFRWCVYAYGLASACRFTLENRNDFDIKDVVIDCDYIAPSGTIIGRQRAAIFDIIRAKSTRTFEQFKVGYAPPQAQQAACTIVDFDVPEPTGSKP